MNKSEIRTIALGNRKALSTEELNKRSLRIANRIISSFDFSVSDSVHIFLPILKQNEINTFFLIKALLGLPNPPRIIVPVSNFKTKIMQSALYNTDTILVNNKYDIPEPVNPSFIKNIEVTHVITPLLAFDESGHRIGYGGGFYDRFFEEISDQTAKIGVALSSPYPKFDFAEKHDIKLDYCVLEDKLITFNT